MENEFVSFLLLLNIKFEFWGGLLNAKIEKIILDRSAFILLLLLLLLLLVVMIFLKLFLQIKIKIKNLKPLSLSVSVFYFICSFASIKSKLNNRNKCYALIEKKKSKQREKKSL